MLYTFVMHSECHSSEATLLLQAVQGKILYRHTTCNVVCFILSGSGLCVTTNTHTHTHTNKWPLVCLVLGYYKHTKVCKHIIEQNICSQTNLNLYLLSVINTHKYSIENDKEIATACCEHHSQCSIVSIHHTTCISCTNCSVFPCVHVCEQLSQAEQHNSPCK